jgi:hypothetical protein
MRYWQNIVNGKQSDEWLKTVSNKLNQCIKFLSNLDYDFILLQETFPFNFKNYVTYYHQLSFELESEQIRNEITPNNSGWWGSSICINKRNKFLNNCFYGRKYDLQNRIYCASSKMYNGKLYFGDNYINSRFWAFPALMCLNCECEGKIVTIINIYGKYRAYYKNNYEVLDNMYEYIKSIVDNYGNGHLILLAGDFNATIQQTNNDPHGNSHNINLFAKIENELGFKDCRNDHFTTDWGIRNDYIFVNKDYYKYIQPNKEKISDHYLIDCEIKY